GALGARALGDAVARTGVAAAALMVAVAMLVAFGIMVSSFRRTVDTWITQTIRGDLYVEPVGHRLSGSATVLPPAFVDALAAVPGVSAVDRYRASHLPLGGRDVLVVGLDFGVQAARGRLQFVSHVPVPGAAGGAAHAETRDVLAYARARDAAIVSESFARHRGVASGDTLSLPLPAGRARIPVAGVIYDYSTDAGAIYLDRDLDARLTGSDRTESVALYLAPGADPERVRRAVAAAAGDSIALALIPNQALRARVLTVFDQTFQVTWALQAIALLVAVLGVVGTLTALIAQRARDLGVLRAIGATRGQLERVVLVESGLLGLTGALLGCVAGLTLALLLIDVINVQFFGWTIRLTIEPGRFVRAIALITGTALLAGIAPARRAASRPIADAMRTE
ncbi:MAG TPA: ABC transporter permease, partial [Candidatus Eisenbacteria bacterium]|nr:ABC transporter permease [Candidatus Eisenbacteria bacterium]